MSVLKKVVGGKLSVVSDSDNLQPTTYNLQLNPEEHLLARHLSYYPDIVVEAGSQLSPSHVARYLTELAQLFNVFYAKHQILSVKASERQSVNDVDGQKSPDALTLHDALTPETVKLRLALTRATAAVLKDGLWLIGIETVERM